MFDNKKIEVIVPPGPYPKHSCGMGELLPKVEPATGHYTDDWCGHPIPSSTREVIIPDAVVLYWQCSHCKERI